MSNLVPEGWISSPLGDVLNKILDFRGRTPKKLGMTWGGGNIRALSANNVQMGKVNFQKECYLASLELYQQWMTKGETEKGDVLFTMEAPLGNVALVPNDDKYILSQRVILLKNDRTKILSDFLFQQMRSDSFQNVLRENATGSTALGIQQKRLVTLDVVLPPLPEQKKIAAILTSVDDVIEKTQAQIDKLKDLKIGMMQELLTSGVGVDGKPHREFKDSPVGKIPKGWKSCLLDKVAKRGSGHTPDKKKPEYWNDGVKWVSLTDSSKLDKLYISDTAKKISQLGIENSSATLHPKGTVVMARDAGVGKSAIMTSSMAVSQHFMAWVCGEKLDNYFLYYLLQHWKPQFEAIAMGSTIKTIGLPYFKKLQIPVPSIEEQRVISGALKSVDNKMFALERKHKQLTNTKKALMQDLLTGKVRVKVDS